jgi:DNA-binding transcriptional LysR family regulator
MEVRQLQIFRILAEELNFTRTAELVHTVQSNVTTQIKALEDELGAPLFDRLGRRVSLTEAGRRFQPFVERALKAMEEGQRAILAGAGPSGPLRIGAPESVLAYRLPAVIRAFRKKFPDVELVFRPFADAKLAAELETGKLDLAIHMDDEGIPPTAQPAAGMRITSMHLRNEVVHLLSDMSHPLARCAMVRAGDLEGQVLLLTEAGCGYRAKLDKVLALANVRPASIVEFSSVEAIKQCVAAGMGLALLPEIVVSREVRLQQLKALAWDGPALDIATHLVWHKDKWISPAMSAFMEMMKDKLEASDERQPKLTLDGVLAG